MEEGERRENVRGGSEAAMAAVTGELSRGHHSLPVSRVVCGRPGHNHRMESLWALAAAQLPLVFAC